MSKVWQKQLIVGFVSLGLVFIFYWMRIDTEPLHAWNRAFADVSLLYLWLIMLYGSILKVMPTLTKWKIWRRDVGIWTGVTAIVHILIILDGWVEWELFRLFYAYSQFSGQWVIYGGFALGNILGIVAFVYMLMLLLTSNRVSERILGITSWRYLQQSVHIVYVLVILHTFYFVFLHNPHEYNWLRIPFIVLVILVVLFQIIVFTYTLKKKV